MRAITIFLLLIIVTGYSQGVKYPKKGTIYAYDKASNGLIHPINVWEKKERPGGQVIQLIYLLQGTWNAVSTTGARLRVFVRP